MSSVDPAREPTAGTTPGEDDGERAEKRTKATPTTRMPPFYCPYCGEEDLVPHDERGGWYCQSCARAFQLSFTGVGVGL